MDLGLREGSVELVFNTFDLLIAQRRLWLDSHEGSQYQTKLEKLRALCVNYIYTFGYGLVLALEREVLTGKIEFEFLVELGLRKLNSVVTFQDLPPADEKAVTLQRDIMHTYHDYQSAMATQLYRTYKAYEQQVRVLIDGTDTVELKMHQRFPELLAYFQL